MPQETRNKILNAALELMSKKGFSATTTKEISRLANLSEMTLFRKYSSKREILDCLIEQYTSSFQSEKLFTEHKPKYDLEIDLAHISRTYQTFMNDNRRIVLLAYKESGTFDEISEKLTANPRFLKKYLIKYLEEMGRRNKIIDIDIESTVLSFMSMNLGYFSSQFISIKKVSEISLDMFIDSSVKVFARGLGKDLEK